MATDEANLNAKLIQLQLAVGRTAKVIESANLEAIERHEKALKSIVGEADQLKISEESRKIVAGENLEEISEWNLGVETTLATAEREINRLKKWREDYNRVRDANQKEQELEFERKLFETRLKFQADLQQAKATQDVATVKSATASDLEKEMQVKLPKLTITKFNGTYEDWPRFWGQFQVTVDQSTLAPVLKFAHLRELLEYKVKKTVEALPFTSEGYNRAKSILQERYGKQSEIVKAYTKQILDLPTIPNANLKRIHEFTDKLTYAVQSLETLGKLAQVNGNVAMTLDKLPAIRGDLVRTDDSWETWDFVKLTEALRLWTRRNPVDKAANEKGNDRPKNPGKLFNARRQDPKPRGCVYCEDTSHKPTDCPKVTSVSERREILKNQRLCYNCTGSTHRANECQSKSKCLKCDRRHHTSICDQVKPEGKGNKLLISAEQNSEGIFPIVQVVVDGVECRALIDTGAGSSYASAKLINLLRKKPIDVSKKKVDMLMSSQVAKLETYQTVIASVDGDFQMEVNLTKVNKEELLFVDNPHYQDVIKQYSHLEGVEVVDQDEKPQLPVHVVLSSGEFARIKTTTKPRVGNEGEPIAELTRLGWFIVSPGKEFDHKKMLLAQTGRNDYEELCRLDVLGLEDTPENDQASVYTEFKEQLERDQQGWYSTGLPWKGNHPHLANNKHGSLSRLDSLVRKLERTGKYEAYNEIIQDHLEEGVIETAPEEPSEKEFYLPHKAVEREKAESTKLRVVYDASAKEQHNLPSLNECLNPGPPLQNKLWNVLVRERSYPVAVCGDIKKAFLQVRIKKSERDALRFHWRHPGDSKVQIYRFSRALFGLTCSPFLLGGVIDQHLELWQVKEPELVEELRKNLYVDDLLSGGDTTKEAQAKKLGMAKILEDATFKLHKWNASEKKLEENTDLADSIDEQSFAKQQFRVERGESKLLGTPWNKTSDTLTVLFPDKPPSITKRGILSKLARVYDPLGLVSPITVQGKMIYREVCDAKKPWDAELDSPYAERWKQWEESLPKGETVPRSIAQHQEKIQSITLHAFGDASNNGVCAAVYAVVEQSSGTTQSLIAAKSRLAKRGLTIPRLELIGAHMATNLITNVQQALEGRPVASQHCWIDSTVVLYWIQGQGKFKQFVANRINKIQRHSNIEWHFVPTKENPADLGSRGARQLNELWRKGPPWLCERESWPASPVLESTADSQAEEKIERQVLTTAIQPRKEDNVFDILLVAHISHLWRTLRVGAWVNRFLSNAKLKRKDRKSGPLTTSEIEEQRVWWIKRAQRHPTNDEDQKDKVQLNVQRNEEGILECRGRLIGQYPVYLPDTAPFTEALVRQAHIATLHGGVTLTMARLREIYWIPRLRKMVKQVRSSCWGCKRFNAIAYASPPPGQLPTSRTEGETPYQIVGIDFAGPIKHVTKAKTEKKAYLCLIACSLTRGVYLELLHSLETEEFLRCLKKFVARRGRPKVIYTDNASTFKGAAEWIRKINKDEQLHGFLAKNVIEWKFNMSRAPWWGGQFERLVGVFKSAFHKTIGNGTLTFDELSEVVTDVEVAINGRPLDYVEEDVQLPLLTPNSLLFLQPNMVPEMEAHHIEEPELRRRARYLSKTKDVMWNRWSKEYVRSLRGRHRLQESKEIQAPAVGDMVIIRGDEKNRNLWKLGKVVDLIHGRDGVVRGAKVQTGKGTLERTPQHLYPLELRCDDPVVETLNPEAPTFRPRRQAAEIARQKISDIATYEQDPD